MTRRGRRAATVALLAAVAWAARADGGAAQTLATDDPVLRAIWDEATNRSRLEPLAQVLLDSIGPRLTGSPGSERAQEWAVSMLEGWGIEAERERYGTWEGWLRGPSHVDLVEPRVRSLEGRILAWSPGTGGEPVEAEAVALPFIASAGDWQAFLGTVRDRWIMLSFPQPTCRPDEQWVEFQQDGSGLRMAQARQEAQARWSASLEAAGRAAAGSTAALHAAIEDAGAAGIVTSQWPGAPGTVRVFDAENRGTPTFDLSCEDYGLVHRLAENGQRPVVRLTAEAESLGEVPVHNVIGRIPGVERPNEYVILSAHYDSWDGASGATDNGSGSVLMLETMRVLSEVYPRPRRTILIALWNGEEQGLNGSRAFVEDHPEIVEGIQAVFNQDNGTGRVTRISAMGLVDAGGELAEWLSQVPEEVKGEIELELPGNPGGSGSDYASFVCAGAPAFPLSALSWDYTTHTWHTNRDTYDKLIFDDLRRNVVLTASLAYLAASDPDFVSRRRRELLAGRGGGPGAWPECRPARRSSPSAGGR